jgi:hypothetical protein
VSQQKKAERDRVCAIAESWIGTPFHDEACVKGAGVDCAQLLRGVFVEAGLVAPFDTGHYSPQHFMHSPEERFLGWVQQFAHEIPQDEVRPGDIVLYRICKAFAHGAIVVQPGWPEIVHAHYASRRVIRAKGTAVHLGTKILGMKFFTRW